MRLFFLFLLVLLTPVWADIPVPPEVERRSMQQDIDRQTSGMSPAQQYAKVQQMLADMPKRIADEEKRYRDAEAAEQAGKRGGEPAYMIGKSVRYLEKQKLFLQEWLSTHRAPSPQSSNPTAPPAPPPAPAGTPVTPAMLVGLGFLAVAILVGGRRALHSPA